MRKETQLLLTAGLIICAGIFFLFFKPLVSPGEILNFSDVIHVWYFFKYFTVQSIRKFGELPLWNPLIYSGVPLVGNPQSTFFYPPFLIFFFLPVQWAITLLFAAHMVFAGMGMYIFARKKQLPFVAALFAAAVFILNRKTVGHVFAGHLTQTCSWSYIPWLFICLEKLSARGNLKNIVLFSICVSMIFFCGQMQIFYYQMVIGLVYLLTLISGAKSNPAKTISVYLAGVFTAVALVCVSLLPVLETVFEFHRAGGTDYIFATSDSLKLSDFITLIYPNYFVTPAPGSNTDNLFFWEHAVYIGIAPLFLSLISYNTLRKKKLWFFLCLAVFSIMFSLGSNSPLFKIMYLAVPGIKYFRCPARMYLFASFSAAILSGFALQYVMDNTKSISVKHLCRLMFIIGLIAVFFNEVSFFYSGKMIGGSTKVIAVIFLTWSVLLLRNRFSIGKTFFAVMIFAVTLFDLGSLAYPIIKSVALQNIFPNTKIYEHIINDRSIFRVFDNSGAMPQYVGAQLNIQQVGGDEPVMLGRYLDYIDEMYVKQKSQEGIEPTKSGFEQADLRLKFDWRYLNLLNAKYVYSFYPIKHGNLQLVESFDMDQVNTDYLYGAYPELIKAPKMLQAKTYLYLNHYCLQRAFAIPSESESIDEAVDSVLSNAEKRVMPAKIIDYQPNKLSFEMNVPVKSYFIVSEIFYPGWKAYVNKKEVLIKPVKNLFRGLDLPPGENHIEFVYCPVTFSAGKIVSVSAWIALFLVAVLKKLGLLKK